MISWDRRSSTAAPRWNEGVFVWRWHLLGLMLVALSACGGETSVSVAASGDPNLATPNPPEEVALNAILEHVNTQVSGLGDGWERTDEWYTEGAITDWDSGCAAFDRLGDIFNVGTPTTSVWQRGNERAINRTDKFNWAAYEFAFDVERIPDTCAQVDAGATTVQVSFVDEAMFSESLANLNADDPRGVIVAIMLDAYPLPDPETDIALPEFEPDTPTWVVIATRHNVVSQLIYAPGDGTETTGIVGLVDAQIAALVGAAPEATGSFGPPEPTPSVAPGVAENVQLVLGDECRNDGTVEAGGVSWRLAEAAPFEWAGRPTIVGNLEMDGTVATFTPNGEDGTPTFSVTLTTGATNADCPLWELSEPVEPSNVIGNLDCGESPMVENRMPDNNSDPLDVATAFIPSTFRVEPASPLFWDAFDSTGELLGTLAIGDSDNPDWQIWACG